MYSTHYLFAFARLCTLPHLAFFVRFSDVLISRTMILFSSLLLSLFILIHGLLPNTAIMILISFFSFFVDREN